jgi:uncharacterized protein (TIGR02001 family)
MLNMTSLVYNTLINSKAMSFSLVGTGLKNTETDKSKENVQKLLYFSLKALCMFVFLSYFSAANAEIHGTITGTTDYVWRMYSKSNNEPAIQANLDYQHSSGFYTGATVSSFNIGPSELETEFGLELDFNDPAKVEIIPYVGWSFKIADDWRTDLQYSRYFYDGNVYTPSGDYNEFYVFLHYKDLVTAQASYAEDFYGLDGAAFFYELTGRYPITDFLQISSTLGYGHTQGILLDDYEYWNVGLTGTYKFISMDLRYHDAREMGFGDQFELPADHANTLKSTVVFSLSVGF